MKKIIIVILFISTSFAIAQEFKYNKDEIFRAMKDEIDRSMKDLKLESLQKPYYIAYTLKLRKSSNIKSSLGSVIDSNSFVYASINVDLRVGNYKLDNSNFFDVGLGFFGSTDDEEVFKNRRIPYGLSYNSIRRELWLATDAAYKQNSEIYSKKLSVMQNRVLKDTTYDFLQVEPSVNYNIQDVPYFDMKQNAELVNTLSAIFKDYKDIYSSSVSIENVPEITFYFNSEGMKYINTDYYTGIEVGCFTQNNDGMPLGNFYSNYSVNPKDIPSLDSLKSAVNGTAQILTNTCKSEIIDEPYSGPVIFAGQAAAELIAQQFAPQLVAIRPIMSEGGVSTDNRNSIFQNKIGGRVLPEFLSLKALPTIKDYEGTNLLGYFQIDDDGLKSKDVEIVKNGFLKTLLSDRVPTRRVKQSAAHKRGGAPMYSTLQLFSEKSKELNDKQLEQKMLKLVKDRELPYGIIVKKIVNQNIMYTTLYRTSGGLFQIPRGDGKLAVAEAYKVYPNGKKELIRGAEINNLSVSLFKDILFTGKKSYALNLLAPSVISSYISGGDQYVGASIITPDLLFEDVEVKSIEGSFQKPPLMSNPLSKGE
ncbi:MAG TPA: metallopeptidase TldD-related protein [Candidatus Kapabacteria bacterium]|nr:metallopeptidase TldD-related protein [Candidatus Kapabacteria bacterium]